MSSWKVKTLALASLEGFRHLSVQFGMHFLGYIERESYHFFSIGIGYSECH